MISRKGKGQAETPFVLGVCLLIAFFAFFSIWYNETYPAEPLFTLQDLTIIGASFIGVAGACSIATGIPCAAALVIFNGISLISLSNVAAFAFFLLPLSVTISYVAARLARGGG